MIFDYSHFVKILKSWMNFNILIILPLVGWIIGRWFRIGFQLPKLIFGISLITLWMPLGMKKPEKIGHFEEQLNILEIMSLKHCVERIIRKSYPDISQQFEWQE